MKKRNNKFLKEKEYIRLTKRLDEISNIQKSLGWEILPNPKFIGWTAKLKPREDILNRIDNWVFINICNKFGYDSFARKIEYFEWEQKGKLKDRHTIYNRPHISIINQFKYDSLSPQERKWFKSTEDRYSSWYCTIPYFYWDIVYEKTYQTKVKISDVLLEQEESDIEKNINWNFREFKYIEYGSPKHFRKMLNKKQRLKSKKTLFNIIKSDMDFEFEDNYKGADWLYW